LLQHQIARAGRSVAVIYFEIAAVLIPVKTHIVGQIANAHTENRAGAEIELRRTVAGIRRHIVVAVGYLDFVVAAKFELHFVFVLGTVVNLYSFAVPLVALLGMSCGMYQHSRESHTEHGKQTAAKADHKCVHNILWKNK
jgi:hypothetical protein